MPVTASVSLPNGDAAEEKQTPQELPVEVSQIPIVTLRKFFDETDKISIVSHCTSGFRLLIEGQSSVASSLSLIEVVILTRFYD